MTRQDNNANSTVRKWNDAPDSNVVDLFVNLQLLTDFKTKSRRRKVSYSKAYFKLELVSCRVGFVLCQNYIRIKNVKSKLNPFNKCVIFELTGLFPMQVSNHVGLTH